MIVLWISWFFIPALVTTLFLLLITGRWRILVESKGELKSLSIIRNKVLESVDPKRLVSLDEFWEVGITILTLSVVGLSLLNQDTQGIAGWTQVIITIVFWASYKIAKAKHSVDLRILIIGSLIQLLAIIFTLLGLSFLLMILVQTWIGQGSPQEPGYIFPQWEWMILDWIILLGGTCFLLITQAIGKRFGRYCWNYLYSDSNDVDSVRIESNALVHLENSMPSYLFYGILWFISFFIPSAIEFGLSEFMMELVIATIMIVVIVFLSWFLKIYYVNRKVMNKQFSIVGKIFIQSGSLAIRLTSLVITMIMIVIGIIYMPMFSFSFNQYGQIGFIVSNGLIGGMLLLIVQGVSIAKFGKKETDVQLRV